MRPLTTKRKAFPYQTDYVDKKKCVTHFKARGFYICVRFNVPLSTFVLLTQRQNPSLLIFVDKRLKKRAGVYSTVHVYVYVYVSAMDTYIQDFRNRAIQYHYQNKYIYIFIKLYSLIRELFQSLIVHFIGHQHYHHHHHRHTSFYLAHVLFYAQNDHRNTVLSCPFVLGVVAYIEQLLIPRVSYKMTPRPPRILTIHGSA